MACLRAPRRVRQAIVVMLAARAYGRRGGGRHPACGREASFTHVACPMQLLLLGVCGTLVGARLCNEWREGARGVEAHAMSTRAYYLHLTAHAIFPFLARQAAFQSTLGSGRTDAQSYCSRIAAASTHMLGAQTRDLPWQGKVESLHVFEPNHTETLHPGVEPHLLLVPGACFLARQRTLQWRRAGRRLVYIDWRLPQAADGAREQYCQKIGRLRYRTSIENQGRTKRFPGLRRCTHHRCACKDVSDRVVCKCRTGSPTLAPATVCRRRVHPADLLTPI